MKNKIMQLVDQICNTESANCKSLNKADLARELMNLANIPQNADIQEIPLDWNRQVEILFLLPDGKNYYSLFAGIGRDGKFYFKLSITGKLMDNGCFDFFEEHGERDQILPIDYFVNQNKKEEPKIKEKAIITSRAEAMEKQGYKRSFRLAKEGKADTINYGVLPLINRSLVCGCLDSSYEETDNEYEVDIYLYRGEYVAVDSFDRW